MVGSLVQLCIRFVVKNIERWAQHITLEHIKECSYLVTSMHQLPQELVQKILGLLISSSKLSLQTLALFLDDQIQQIDLHGCNGINDTTLKAIGRHSRYITNLNISNCLKIQQLDALIYLRKLEYLNIANCRPARPDDAIKHVFQNCRQLFSLNLQNIAVTDASLSLLPLSPCRLTLGRLNIAQTKASSQCISSILQACTNLQVLSLEGCFDVSDETFLNLSAEPSLKMTELNISLCQIHDATITKIVSHFVNISTLYLQGCPITDFAMKGIAEKLKQLKILKLNSCTSIGKQGITSLAKSSNPISYLDLSNLDKLNDSALRIVSEHLTDIQFLILDNCPKVGSAGVVDIATGCNKLTTISLKATKVTDPGISVLTSCATKLQNINLDCCKISDAAVKDLAACARPPLNRVSLASCTRIEMTDSLVQLCKRAKWVDLSGCSGIDSMEASKLRKMAPKAQIVWT